MSVPTPQQGTQNPPIPTLPTSPGAATGGQAPVTGVGSNGAVVVGSPGDEAKVAADAARDAVRNVIRTTVRDGLAQGEPVVLVPPNGNSIDIPPDALPIIGTSLGLLLAMIVGYPIARAIGRVIERRGDAGIVRASEVVPQLRRLQESVDTMAIELERISEAQRFTAKLAAERSATALPGGGARPG
jgi:hypothetical protein